MSDAISPNHYAGSIECIDAMRQVAPTEQFVGFCRLTALKYIWRCGAKDLESQEIRKGMKYLEWCAEALEKEGR